MMVSFISTSLLLYSIGTLLLSIVLAYKDLLALLVTSIVFIASYNATSFYFNHSINSAPKKLYSSGSLFKVLQYLYEIFYASKDDNNAKKNITNEHPNHCGNKPVIDNEIKTLITALVSTYIECWYNGVSNDQDFLNDCNQAFEEIFQKLKYNLCNIDMYKFVELALKLICDNLYRGPDTEMESTDNFTKNENLFAQQFSNHLLDLCKPKDLEKFRKRLENVHNRKAQNVLDVMVNDLLVHGLFLPVINFLSDPQYLKKNIFYFVGGQFIQHDRPVSTFCIEDTVNPHLEPNLLTPGGDTGDLIQRNLGIPKLMHSTSTPQSPIMIIKQYTHRRSNSEEILTQKYPTTSASSHHPGIKTLSIIRNSSLELSKCEEALETDTTDVLDQGIDTRLFRFVRISKTQEAQTEDTSYILYCIQYEALFEEVKNQEEGKDPSSTLIRKNVRVKRRFREFITLQNRLEENKELKLFLRRIKMPSKIKLTTQNLLSFSGSKFDKTTLEYRRLYLEQFLIDLCNRAPIADSAELQQFLAYGSDARLAYVTPKQGDIKPYKMIVNGFKEAINLIKTAIPVEYPQDGKIDLEISPTIKSVETVTYSTRKFSIGYESEIRLIDLFKTLDLNSEVNEILKDNQNSGTTSTNQLAKFEVQKTYPPSPDLDENGCAPIFERQSVIFALKEWEDVFESEIPLSSKFMKCLFHLFQDEDNNEDFAFVFKIISGQLLERLIKQMITSWFSKENVVYIIHKIHENLSTTMNASTEETNLLINDEEITDQILKYIQSYFHESISLTKNNLIYTKIGEATKCLIKLFDSQQRNKCLIFNLLSYILNEMQNNSKTAQIKINLRKI